MITIYSTDWCAPCKTLKTYLDRKKIQYEVIDADKHADDLIALTGRRLLPTTIIGDKTIEGLNISVIAKELGI